MGFQGRQAQIVSLRHIGVAIAVIGMFFYRFPWK
jgi:hypothetical protein